MADKRFTDNTNENSPDDLDIIPGTDVSTGNDAKYTFTAIAAKVKALIGNATISINGLQSAADKTKLDGYAVQNPGNSLYLTTNGSGVQTWIPIISVVGDMLKSVYDTGDNGQVDVADEADKLTGTPGNDKVYVTDNVGNQQFSNQSDIADMKKSAYATVSSSKVDTAILADSALTILGVPAVIWTGQTTGGTPTEIFIDGISAQLLVPNNQSIGAIIQIFAFRDDFSESVHFVRQVAIVNDGGTTTIQDAVKIIGGDINAAGLGGVIITADNGTNALKLEVDGAPAQTWNWKARTIYTIL